MRLWLLFPLALFILLLPSCRSDGALTHGVEPGPPDEPMIVAATRELARNGSFEAEAFLSAAGPVIVPELTPLLSSADPDVKKRATIVLLSVGHEVPLSSREQVELALFEITRTDGQPWSRLDGLVRLDGMGESAVPELRWAALQGGDLGAVAHRLLYREQEEP